MAEVGETVDAVIETVDCSLETGSFSETIAPFLSTWKENEYLELETDGL